MEFFPLQASSREVDEGTEWENSRESLQKRSIVKWEEEEGE